jgi:hypothetical protein
MTGLQNRINDLLKAVEAFFDTDNKYLQQAVNKTVEEEYFNASDVQFALNMLKKTINREALEEWIEQSGVADTKDARGQNVLCLHAGNLPLVGIQNVLAVLLSGGRYTGKISRKDPYLLPVFLNEVKKTKAWSSTDVQWSHQLRDLDGMPNDAILFSGSEESIPGVMESVNRLRLKQPETRILTRTAHFSLVYLSDKKPENIKDLTKAILRYGGKGCRSVAGVISPFALEEVADELTAGARQFWEDNPQHQKPQFKLRQQYAYNKAVDHSQVWLDDFLLQAGVPDFPMDFTCFWVQGDEQTAAKIAKQFGKQIQSIYVTDTEINIPDFVGKTEPLLQAQQPPIYWKPDGVDTLNWLCSNDFSL